MKKSVAKPLILMTLLLGVSSCPEKNVPPTTPPQPDALVYFESDYFFTRRGVFPGNAPLSGPGFFFFRMMA